MSEDENKPNSIIVDFLEGLIALDEEEKNLKILILISEIWKELVESISGNCNNTSKS